jgi:hypothetical protein
MGKGRPALGDEDFAAGRDFEEAEQPDGSGAE